MKRNPECHPDKPHYAKGQCERCYAREYDRRSRPRRRESYKAAKLKNRYGLTREAYAALLAKYDSCGICGGPWGNSGPHVDHNHETRTVRGLLCHSCNSGLGLFKEDPRVLKEALRYLELWG